MGEAEARARMGESGIAPPFGLQFHLMESPTMDDYAKRRVRVIDATLTSDSGDAYLVGLIVTAENAEVEDQAATRFELLEKIPDGEYTLEYFSPRPFRGRARVVNGTVEVL
jgi:hypothetical protein